MTQAAHITPLFIDQKSFWAPLSCGALRKLLTLNIIFIIRADFYPSATPCNATCYEGIRTFLRTVIRTKLRLKMAIGTFLRWSLGRNYGSTPIGTFLRKTIKRYYENAVSRGSNAYRDFFTIFDAKGIGTFLRFSFFKDRKSSLDAPGAPIGTFLRFFNDVSEGEIGLPGRSCDYRDFFTIFSKEGIRTFLRFFEGWFFVKNAISERLNGYRDFFTKLSTCAIRTFLRFCRGRKGGKNGVSAYLKGYSDFFTILSAKGIGTFLRFFEPRILSKKHSSSASKTLSGLFYEIINRRNRDFFTKIPAIL